MSTTKKYVVTDAEGYVTYDENDEENEAFSTFVEAEERARELADETPGKPIRIYELLAEVTTEVRAPTTVFRRSA